MPRQIALLICIVFILWLFARDRKLRPMTSMALWIPLLWLMIIGSRPVSLWLGVQGPQFDTLEDYDGSPLDRNVYLFLIVVGALILLKRRIDWGTFVKFNRWFIAFLFFCGISCLWSDYPYIAVKRYIKEVGNVIMMLIIITETNSVEAVRAVLARYAYFVIPLSVIFIKYFPELGRTYSRGTWAAVYVGVSIEKNTLGQIIFISGLFIIWDLIQRYNDDKILTEKTDFLSRGILVTMVVWLLYMANSSTSTACMIVSVGSLLFMRRPSRFKIVNLIIYTLIPLSIFIPFSTETGFMRPFVEMLNRDVTLTGRTEIWQALLQVPMDQLIGKGFESFWFSPEAIKMGERYHFLFNQAHNGYLEVYAHTGLIGLFLFIVAIIAVVGNLKKVPLSNNNYAALLYTLLISFLIYNWTEATINKLSVMWFVPMLAVLYYSDSSKTIATVTDGNHSTT